MALGTAYNLALRMNDAPPILPPLAPSATVCGNCSGWRALNAANPCGGRCVDPESPRFNAMVTRSVPACGCFARNVQLSLTV